LLIYTSLSPILNVLKTDADSENHLLDFENSRFSYILDTSNAGYGVFSCQFSSSSSEVLVGTRAQTIEIHDLAASALSFKVDDAHEDDINSACFASAACDVVFSASDDSLIKLWDRRASNQRPQGVFLGHREGITHLDSKGDGLQLVSNGKDQCIKLWDTRKVRSSGYAEAYRTSHRYQLGYDYRMGLYPLRDYTKKMDADQSLLTFRGHLVMGTLIRCYFSPAETTGQRFVYTGGADGTVMVFDTYTGMKVQEMREEGEENEEIEDSVCRDVAWHPYRPVIAATSFDMRVKLYEYMDDQEF
jgi:DDB1- and CUL4-associated factor 11